LVEVTELVFVYGSLKRCFENHRLMDGATYVREARLGEHCLVRYEESYPGLCGVPGTVQSVQGELFLVTAAHLEELDVFEEVPTLYQRSLVTLEEGTTAWAYVVPPDRAREYPPLKEYSNATGRRR
jgi:gamma-glutamylcyclotransferase (GGCT)/AIG2-like uncharacterized protein YtfP